MANTEHTLLARPPVFDKGDKPRPADLDALYQACETGIRKALGSTPAKFVRGQGNPQAEVMLIGEAPGLDEDRQGQPFIGRSGQLLNRWLETLGLKRADVFITNVVKCHPMKDPSTPEARSNDRCPTPAEISHCLPLLREEISLVRPRVIVTLGSPATRTILGTKETITRLRGRFYALPARSLFAGHAPAPDEEEIQALSGIQVFPLFHPAALLHNPTCVPLLQGDLQTLKAALEESRRIA